VKDDTAMIKIARLKRNIATGLVLFMLIVILIGVLLPLLILLLNAFKTDSDFTQNGPFSLPTKLSFESILNAINITQFFSRLVNSIIISIPTAVLALLLSLLNGYALGIGRIRGKAFIVVFFMLALTLPQEAFIYPIYYMFKGIKLYNSYFGVILCLSAFHLSYGTYLMSTVMKKFPKEFIEAAEIDGAGKLYIFFRIIIPLNMPTISVLFVFFFVWTWNDFFISLILLVSEKYQTIPLGILRLSGQYTTSMTIQGAAALLLSLPCIIFFIIFQRTLTRGVVAGGIKG
jgi:raffinose/stachyose/melibiose transport system permease protein